MRTRLAAAAVVAVVTLVLLVLPHAVLGLLTVRGRVDMGEESVPPLVVRLDTLTDVLVRADGSFVLRNVEPGTHEITVVDALRHFSRVVIDVDEHSVRNVYEVTPNPQPGQPPLAKTMSSVVLKPLGLVDYFEKRQQMSLMSMFANPMMLMMVVTLGLGMVMPKLMENLDPEELKKIQKDMDRNRQVTTDPAGALSDMLTGRKNSEDNSNDNAAD